MDEGTRKGSAAGARGARHRVRSVQPARPRIPDRSADQNTEFDKTDIRNTIPRFTPEARQANQKLVDLLAAIGRRKKATSAQIALAWLLAQKPWIVPIPGTTKLTRLEENIGAVTIELTPEDLREIDSAASEITVHGARYSEELMKMTGR